MKPNTKYSVFYMLQWKIKMPLRRISSKEKKLQLKLQVLWLVWYRDIFIQPFAPGI